MDGLVRITTQSRSRTGWWTAGDIRWAGQCLSRHGQVVLDPTEKLIRRPIFVVETRGIVQACFALLQPARPPACMHARLHACLLAWPSGGIF